MTSRLLRVLVLEDSAADAELIKIQLERSDLSFEMERVSTHAGFADALRRFNPHVIISDHSLGAFDSRAAMKLARAQCPVAPVILVTGGMDAHSIAAATRAGAEEVLFKNDLSRLVPSIQRALEVRRNLDKLSPRQLQVLSLVAQGNTTPEIAAQLKLSAKTIETHRGELMKRLAIHDLASVVKFAIRVGLVSLEP
jgi:DNA-binding NarL/FixJ family response regulator